jgi:peptidoglycan/LPS O-acetylase OafA/YrhL
LHGVVAPEPGRRYGRFTVIEGEGTLMRSARLAIVEALRGFASISVACYHFSGPLDSAIAHGIGSYGWLGVDVFFVISGFVIPLSLYGTDYRIRQFPSFLLRRMVRLEPPYLASIALTILLWHLSTLLPGLVGSPPTYTMAQIGFHLFYLIPLTSYEWLSPPYWSLAYELVFYITVGLTFSIFIARRSELTAVLIAVVATVFSGLQRRFGLDGLLTARVLEFGVGILLMRVIVDHQSRFVTNATLLALCIVATGWLGGWVLGITVGVAALTIFAFREVELGRWAFVVGGCSYSLYLTHTSIGGRVVNLTKGWTGGSEAVAVVPIFLALAVSFSFAMLFAYCFENPSRRLARRLTQRGST